MAKQTNFCPQIIRASYLFEDSPHYKAAQQFMADNPIGFVVISDPFIDAMFRPELHIHWRGGSGSGKSHTKAIEMLLNCLKEPDTKVIYSRKDKTTIRTSQFDVLTSIIEEHGWGEYFKYSTAENSNMKIYCHNGSVMIPMAFSEIHKWTSIAGIKHIWLEEPLARTSPKQDLKKTDLEEIVRRLRGFGAQHIHLTFNPISKNKWVYLFFHGTKKKEKPWVNNFYEFKSCYTDNYFIDQAAYFEENFSTADDNTLNVYARGDWGWLGTDDPWWIAHKAFTIIDKPQILDPTKIIYGSIDFNLDIMAFTIIQFYIENRRIQRRIIATMPPAVDVSARCTQLKNSKWAPYLNRMIFTGEAHDPRSQIKASKTRWSTMRKQLNLRPDQVKLRTHNLQHHASRELEANLMRNHDTFIDPSCEKLLEDLHETQPKPGTNDIDKRHYDPHHGDTLRYFDATIILPILHTI